MATIPRASFVPSDDDLSHRRKIQDEREAAKERLIEDLAKANAEYAAILLAWKKEKEEERERHAAIRARYDAIKADADAKEAAREAKWAEQKVKLTEMNKKMAVQFAKDDNFFGLIGKAVCMTLHGESQSSIVEKARELLPPRE
jgi:septal ring factor EnvC (AmiA/AmiB activator)